MKNEKTLYFCDACGNEFHKWLGKCPSCNAWNSFKEARVLKNPKTSTSKVEATKVFTFEELESEVKQHQPISLGLGESNRVLGGGITEGSVVLLSGEPGIGKSTLVLQWMFDLSQHSKVLYVSGEESPLQVAKRSQRIFNSKLDANIILETEATQILNACDSVKPKFLIIDSIQAIYSASVEGQIGGVSQVKACLFLLTEYCRKNKITMIIIGHVNKDGNVAGPKTLEHMVDVVLSFDRDDNESSLRILRAIKNRFGSCEEIGLFHMGPQGLSEASLDMFVSEEACIGSTRTVVKQGRRYINAEIQSLVTKCYSNFPKRVFQGLDPLRVQIIVGIVEKYLRIPLYDHDIYVKTVNGLKVSDPSADLAIAFSLLGSLYEVNFQKSVYLGEMGLTGKIRSPQDLSKRKEYIKGHKLISGEDLEDIAEMKKYLSPKKQPSQGLPLEI